MAYETSEPTGNQGYKDSGRPPKTDTSPPDTFNRAEELEAMVRRQPPIEEGFARTKGRLRIGRGVQGTRPSTRSSKTGRRIAYGKMSAHEHSKHPCRLETGA